MSSTQPPLMLDFVPVQPRGRALGTVLVLIGVAMAVWMGIDYRNVTAQREGLQQRIAAMQPRATTTKGNDLQEKMVVTEAVSAANVLNAQWSKLLQELELAEQDQHNDIALLSIESDEEKRLVRIKAESRNLPDALAYVSRLQSSLVLRYPVLDSHEVQIKDPQSPVRFQITAEWRQST